MLFGSQKASILHLTVWREHLKIETLMHDRPQRRKTRNSNQGTMSTLNCFFLVLAAILTGIGCNEPAQQAQPVSNQSTGASDRIPVIIDTDANNELDDQHAIAYLLFNGDTFDVRGVTVNTTSSGGNIDMQYAEAERVLKLCTLFGQIPLYAGADADLETIRPTLNQADYDGRAAVEFIIEEARRERDVKLVLIPIGKMTNIALALEKAPDIKDKVRIVWLGSNYPDPGEHNMINDIPAMTYILETNVPFELVMVRYGKSSGSDAVRVTPTDMETNMPGLGPKSEPVDGRHGNTFTHFGDYSIDLFNHIDLHGDPPSRSLFDVVAVAIVKNPSWGQSYELPAPIFEDEAWKERPDNAHKVIIWENFDKEAILADFFSTMKSPVLAERVGD
jgi:inosine-uridine nucleoside N-ribohydrolase